MAIIWTRTRSCSKSPHNSESIVRFKALKNDSTAQPTVRIIASAIANTCCFCAGLHHSARTSTSSADVLASQDIFATIDGWGTDGSGFFVNLPQIKKIRDGQRRRPVDVERFFARLSSLLTKNLVVDNTKIDSRAGFMFKEINVTNMGWSHCCDWHN